MKIKSIQHSQSLVEKLRKDKGIAGLSILLSLIVMLFIIGLIVMIFSLMGSSLKNAAQTSVADNATSVKVINDTMTSISSVTSWFSIFIVIAAMVVLILLTVIIIVAIRGSGMIGQGA